MKKFDLKKIIIISLIAMAWQFIWMIYNNYVPIFLQSGNPNFVTEKVITNGFGLTPAIVGIVMSLDNVASFFLIPFIGMLSDRTWTKFGRRKPFIMASAPFAIVAFAVIPLLVSAIRPELNGKTSELGYLLAPFIVALIFTLLPYATMDLPANILLYDFTPIKKRGTANGIRGLISAMGVLLASLGGAALYKIYVPLPFWLGSALILIALLALVFFVKEERELPREESDEEQDQERVSNLKEIISILKNLPKEETRNVFLLILSITLSYIGISVFQAFFSSYGVTVLGISVEKASTLMAIASIAYIAMAIPSGILADKIGRKKNLLIGVGLMVIIGLGIFFTQNATVVSILLFCLGMAYAMMDVNTGPFMLDQAPTTSISGTYLAFRQLSTSLGFITGPIIGGALIDLLGSNYKMIWIIMTVFSTFGFIFLWKINAFRKTHQNNAQ